MFFTNHPPIARIAPPPLVYLLLAWLYRRFAWGRSRLPLSAEQFNQPFKIQAFARAPADAYLPVAHTCFFSLELPRYSSREVCRR